MRARGHAATARQQAQASAVRGDSDGEAFYRREAEAHERAARANAQTADLHRRRAQRMAARGHAISDL